MNSLKWMTGELVSLFHPALEPKLIDDLVQAAANDNFEELGQPTRMERLRWDLERGANWDEQEVEDDDRSASPTSTVRSLANRINRLALDGTVVSPAALSCADESSSHVPAGISRSCDACVSDIGVFCESVVSVSCQMYLLLARPAIVFISHVSASSGVANLVGLFSPTV